MSGGQPAAVRRASGSDVAAVAAFQTVCWRKAYAGLVPPDYLARVGVAERELRWRERIVAGGRQVALGERDGTVVGVVSWTDVDGAGPPLELTSLYVGAGERGRGVGHQLLAYAIGQRDASLWVFTQNVRAQQLYARVGFTASGASRTDPDTGLGE